MKKLDTSNYSIVEPYLIKVGVNNLFARAVVEHRINGVVYVDDIDNPNTFYIEHPYGMSLLFGNTLNEVFNREFTGYIRNSDGRRDKEVWLQAYPSDWDVILKDIVSAEMFVDNKRVEMNTRVNFSFNREKYRVLRASLSYDDCTVKQSGAKEYDEMPGFVVPKYFWNNADDFVQNAVGYSLYIDDKIVTTAFSAFIHDNMLELGMETCEEFRGKGYAVKACSLLIDYCLENGYEPVWACNLANTGSYKLAEKLGFEQSVTLPYYRLLK
ncbi:MAG: GNAT family N-acetyltransferase [Bacteroidales bacterium]|jgi:GNAT superfamily N-acetyltransferase|nr:GNAT family N-acetyltransferase [Bacteroidales bacterium]